MDYSLWQQLDIFAKPFDSFITVAHSNSPNSKNGSGKEDEKELDNEGKKGGSAIA